MTKRKIDWYYLHVMCKKLAEKVRHAKFKGVAGIARGGLIPAVIISHHLNIPYLTTYPVNADVYDVLVIDDIVDSGKTFKQVLEGQEHRRFASLFVNKNKCNYYPDFFVEETTDWIVFPYETEEDSVSDVTYKERYGFVR
jgi:hypoxanthine phosphoribosyltransferase